MVLAIAHVNHANVALELHNLTVAPKTIKSIRTVSIDCAAFDALFVAPRFVSAA